jgi:carbamoylphosphate synthase large subunit
VFPTRGHPWTLLTTALRFTNKYLMKRCLSLAGLPVAPFRLVVPEAGADPDPDIPLPLVVKPVTGAGSVGVRQVLNQAEWDAWCRQNDGHGVFLAESLVKMDSELHADGVIVDGQVRFCCVSRYTRPLFEACGSMAG